MPKALTAKAVEGQQPDPDRRLEIPDGLLPGLYLIVQTTGAKSWAVRLGECPRGQKERTDVLDFVCHAQCPRPRS